MAIGVVSALGSLAVDVSVSVNAWQIGVSEVSNLSLLQQQMMLFNTGLASAVAGIALIAAGNVEKRVNMMARRPDAPGRLDASGEAEETAQIDHEAPELRPIDTGSGDRIVLGIMAAATLIIVIVWQVST
ncbi:hypothetical protein [Sphingomonas sp. CCH15-F11]|uniref:hypothetical protein n=1 Tax=Sphingomonas sp. CCH15-F11 TaxID=1768785 RepID=UPI0012E3D9F1|nr:hypothetical protein [Sphingomonas sp. CCH15-F11]